MIQKIISPDFYSTKAFNGILFVALFASAASQISSLHMIRSINISPLIVGIVLGMLYGNTLRQNLPEQWVSGILFSSGRLLRAAVVLYGFRLTLQDITSVGLSGVMADVFIVSSTFIGGTVLGTKVLKMPRRLAMLTAAGSSVCGAAAILGTEPVVRAKAHESSIAVGTVVVYGTIAMLLYPLLYKSGLLNLTEQSYGIWVGSTMHEVAHAVAAGNAISPEAGNVAVIVKMLRVVLLAPLLIAVGLWLAKFPEKNAETEETSSKRKGFPVFALLFVLCVFINSLGIIPENVVHFINSSDIFLLTMAMCALGMETNLEKAKVVGPKPFILAGILAIWLMGAGLLVAKYMPGLCS
ncbi:YeiH family protein [Maridesulfovibrio sp.]|uniref:YeiH family protein n=1 Tax=Maridesulfovibrio sp. TaxID=2795000 RepID=UPI0039F0ED70